YAGTVARPRARRPRDRTLARAPSDARAGNSGVGRATGDQPPATSHQRESREPSHGAKTSHNDVMWRRWVIALALVCASACGAREDLPPDHREAAAPPAPTPAPIPNESRPRIVVLGDSLTAGLGLPIGQAYPALLQERLNQD